jgi:hypothetical protein
MKHPRLFLTLLLATIISLPASAASKLVDDFNGATMNFPKWSGFDPADDISEQFIRIDGDDENLVLMNVSDGLGDHSTRTWLTSTHFSSLHANIAVISADGGGGAATAGLEGQYYNANSATPTNQVGDVAAMVFIGERGSGGLQAWWEIRVSTHPDFETWRLDSTGNIPFSGTLLFGNPYKVEIKYDSVRTFTFNLGFNSSDTSGPRQGPVRKGPAAFTRQNLSASTHCCGINPSVHATFDDVTGFDDGTGSEKLLDDFSGDFLDRSVWANHSGAQVISSRVDPAVTGKLFMFVSDENIPPNGRSATDLVLRERNPDRIEAEVSISSNSLLDAGLRGRARLNGYAYNERRDGGVSALPYDGCDGDVYVQVEIDLKDGGLFATAFAGSETPACDTDETLISETFTKLLEFDTEYLLWMERDGKNLVLGLDDEAYRHNITTPIYPPSPSTANGFRRLSARIQGTSTSAPAGADGVFEMLVDNVYVKDSDDDGGSGSSCFIATAAYGSYLDSHVLTLRKFRDEYLLTNSIGTWFVEFYYRHSPPLADYIRERENLRAVVRSGLAVVIYTIEYPLAVVLGLLLLILVVIRQRRMRLDTAQDPEI